MKWSILVLNPFLYSGFTTAVLRWSEKITLYLVAVLITQVAEMAFTCIS
jgi:hypothetical protein